MSTLAIILSLLGVLLLLLALAALFWWLRTQSGMAIRSFYAAVRKMEHEQGIESRYQVPWLMLLGDPREGSQLCLDWQLTPAGRPAWFGRWWADQDGALLVVPQSIFLPSDGGNASTFVWRRLLSMLLRLRGQRPLDGVIWNIPLNQLQDGAQGAADVIVLRRRFAELLQRLGLSVPVYVLISGFEEMPGFQELVAALPEEGRERLLGWSSPYGLDAGWQSYWLDDALEAVVQNMQAAIIEVGALKGELAEDLYRLPDLLLELKGNLRTLLEPVFQGNTQGEAPRFRGLYLGAAQALAESTQLYPGEVPAAQGVFTQALWRQRLIAEQGLAQALPRILRLRQRWQMTVGGIAVVFALCWLLGMLWVWQERQEDARVLSSLLQETHAGHVSLRAPERRQEQARLNVQAFWELLLQAPRWHFSSLIYPSSWGTSLDQQMDQLLRGMARREALVPLQQLQDYQLQSLLVIRNEQRRPDVQSAQPDQWPNYVKARTLAEGVVSLERHNSLLNNALTGQEGVTESLAQLGNDALGLNLDPSSLSRRAFYDRTLRHLSAPGLRPVDLEPNGKQLSAHFQGLMKFWLEQYFLAGNFVTPAGYLKRHLSDLEYGRDTSLKKLEEINALIGHLDDLIVLTNSAWSHGSGEELVPGFRDLMNDVKQSRLLGPTIEASVTQEAEQLRKTFHSQWIEESASRNNLLQRQAGGTLVLQKNISKLARSIDDLLQRDFAVSAMRRPDGSLDTRALGDVSEQQMAQALVYQQSYQDFVAQELAQIAPDYRAGMLKAAEQAAALAMWSALTSSGGSYSDDATQNQFNVSVEQAMQVIQALKGLGRADLASTLQSQLTLRAMADVAEVLADIDTLPLFTLRYPIAEWDGKPNLGLKLFRATDIQDLKASLARQFTDISTSTDKVLPELTWLRAQNDLPLPLQEKVSRLGSINDDMKKYKAQNPTSAPALFEQLVSRDLVEMDIGNCRQVLSTASLPPGDGDLARYTQGISEQARQRCNELQTQDAAQAWSALASYFNQYLAGRFPFSYNLDSSDADPARVKHLLELIDTHLEAAEKGLALAPAGNRLAAEDFLARMKQARSWLGPLFIRDQSGVIGVELEVRWRTDREDEEGADQVIAWTLNGAGHQIAHPGESGQRLRWNVGDPLQLVLRWARDSNQRPVIDPLQASMAVNGLEAGWEYRGPWALLRMMRVHVVPQHLPNTDYTDFPLTLQVPVRGMLDASPQAQMFMRLSLLSQGSKLPLSIQPLPVVAPASPFASFQLQASYDEAPPL
ncbi:type VI secretion system protein [Ectopseudomonas khazarica]|uniref:Type VI secretion system protein ImpL n=1 Tax=Ectopseudomonas oleovorans TaxID=301 RepID=A0A653BCX3_ECTOL|nr:IcmF-related protein [Pseudomonas oleovorans]